MPYADFMNRHLKATPFRQTTTDSKGFFDFGNIPVGHYELLITTPWKDWGSNEFDVEIVDGAKRNRSVLIDVSPISPDCTGGHEFFALAE